MNKKTVLKNIFEYLNEQQIEYILLRNHDDIPEHSSLKNDLDILIHEHQLEQLRLTMKQHRFKFFNDSIRKNVYLYGSRPHIHFINKSADIHFDVVTSLSYRSLNAGEWVPVHKDFQISAWKNKILEKETIWKYRLSDIDCFLHILCHCIFDKRHFTPRYKTFLFQQYNTINPYLLETYFHKIFFKATPCIVKSLAENDFDKLISNYLMYKEY